MEQRNAWTASKSGQKRETEDILRLGPADRRWRDSVFLKGDPLYRRKKARGYATSREG